MKIDKRLLRRVRILNIGIIFLLAVSFFGNFAKGFTAGWQMAEYEEKAKVSTSFHVVNLEATNHGIGSPITNNGTIKGGLSISQAMVTLTNPPKSTVASVVRAAFSISTLAIFIILSILIWKTTSSIGRGQMMTAINIRRARIIGILLILKEAIAVVLQYVEAQYLNSAITIEGYRITVEVWSTSLVIGLVMFLFAEILTVANRLREEQELTI
jgi:hypothetical protein